jgi:RNA polymerase sigma-B factor
MKAVDRWDPDRGNTFSTFAVPTIIGELQRHFRDRTWTIRPPRDLQELYLRVQRTRAAVNRTRPRAHPHNVAHAIGCDVEDVMEALAAGDAYTPSSLDAPAQADEGDGVTGAAQLRDDGRDIARCEDAAALQQLGEVLDDRSWEVIRLRFQEASSSARSATASAARRCTSPASSATR